MAASSSEMDSLFEGMDFVMPLESESEPPVANHVADTKSVKEREVERDQSALTAPESMTVSIPPIISPSVDPITPLSQAAVGLSPAGSSSALPSESTPAAPASPPSQGILLRDPSAPLDEELFSGLTLLPVGSDTSTESKLAADRQKSLIDATLETTAAPIVHEKSRSFDGAERIGNGDRDGGSLEGIMAGYNGHSSVKYGSSGIPPISKTGSGSAPLAVKPSMRRKRRSMKIGYGREEEENEELLSRQSAIREALGGAHGREDVASVSSSSTPAHAMSRENSQGALYAEESTLGSSLVSQDSEVFSGMDMVRESVNGERISPSISAASQYSTLDIQGLERVASREIADEDVAQLVSSSVGRLESGSVNSPEAVPDVAVGNEEDVTGPGISSSGAEAKVEGEEAVEQIIAILGSSNVETESALTKDGEVEGGGEATDSDEVDLDIELLAQECEGTVVEKLDYVKELVAKRIKLLQRKSSAIIVLRKAAIQKRRKAAETVATASSKCKELEAELESACEREDFEKADILTGSISEAETNLAQATEAFTVAEAESDSTSLTMQEVLNLHVAVEEKGAKILELLKLDAQDAAEKVLTEAQEASNQKMERLDEAEKALELRKANLDVEFQLSDKETAELNAAIGDLTTSESKQLAALVEKKSQLNVELEALMALVRAKETEIAQCKERIAAVEQKVASVAATFEEQKSGLDVKLGTLAASALELEKDSNLLYAEKDGIAKSVADAEKERLRLLEVAACAQDAGRAMQEAAEMKKAAALMSLQSREKRSELALQEKQAQAEAEVLRQDASSARLSLQDLTSTKVKLSQELGAAKDRVNFVEKRAPALDAEKKLAAAARNFKVAGRLAAEAKVLGTEKELASADMARIVKELEKVEAEAEVKLCAMADLDSLVTGKEKEAAIARCQRLWLVAAAARGERDIAFQLEDSEEAENLESEAKSADAEAEEIQKIYQLDDRECREYGNSEVTENIVDPGGKEAAMAEYWRLRQVAASARAERDAAVELDKFEDAEELDSKAESADADAEKLQRLYHLEGKNFES